MGLSTLMKATISGPTVVHQSPLHSRMRVVKRLNFSGTIIRETLAPTVVSLPTEPWSAVGTDDADREMSVDNKSVYIPVVGDAHRTIVIEEFESKNSSSGLINLTFDNESGQDVELFWHNYNGDEVSYGVIAAGQTRIQGTYATHPWTVVGLSDITAELVLDGKDIFVPTTQDNNRTIYIGEDDH